jgi:fibronectin type 3 domain-containing protein
MPLTRRPLILEMLEGRDMLSVDVLTYRNDNTGAGANLNETQLSPANVVPGGAFGKLFSVNVDGQVYSEPLVKTGVTIANGPNTTSGAAGVHDVVFVATENDSVYAIDDNLTATVRVLWQRSFLNLADSNDVLPGATAVTTFPNSFDVVPQVGITGTPVIDPNTNLLYVVTKTQETVSGVTHYVQRLHALRLSDGTDAVATYLIGDTINDTTHNTQIYVYGTSNGTDTVVDPYNNTGKTVVQFNALREFERCDLSLVNNTLYVEWASHNDQVPYHGWIVAWDVSQLFTSGFQLKGVFNDSPNGNEGGIWEGGGTLAFEPDGSAFYLETGNGPGNKGVSALDANGFPVDGNYYNALLKIVADTTTSPSNQNINGWGLEVADYFIPYNTLALDSADQDFGSGGPLLLPDSAGIPNHPHLILAAGKEGKIYLCDRDHLGKFDPNNDHVINAVPNGTGQNTPPVLINGSLSTPAYYNGTIYWVSGYKNVAKTFTIASDGTLVTTSQTTATFGTLPGSPIVSAAGTTNGIVWIMDRTANEIHAYDAESLSNELWNSGIAAGGADAVGAVTKFAPATVANGEVFVGTLTSLVVYGTQPPATSVPAAPSLSASAISNSSVNLFWTDPSVKPNTASGYSIEDSINNVKFTVVTTAPGGSTTISIGGLAGNTTYHFRIRGFNSIGYANYSNVVSATTSSQIPALDFSGGFAGAASTMTLNGSAAIVGSKLELTSGLSSQTGSAYSTATVDITKFTTQFTFHLTAGASTADGFCFVVQNLAPTALGAGGGGLGYSGIANSVAVKFDLFNNAGEGSDSTGLFTKGFSPNVPAIDLTSTGIDLHSGDIFFVSMSYDGTTLGVTITDTTTSASASQSYTVNIPSFTGGTSAFVGFCGSTGSLTVTSDILTWTYTPTTAVAPTVPSGLGGAPLTATSVGLAWTNNATNQTGFRLDRANDPGFTQGLITQLLPATPNSFTDTAAGLAPGSTFYYRIRAYNNAGDSANSNTASVPVPLAPATPTNAMVTSVTTGEIDMSWTDNAGRTATGYSIQRSVGNGAFMNYTSLPAQNTTPPSTYTWSDTGVVPGTFYGYHIVAYNTSGNNDFAGTNATTIALPPSLTATPSGNAINLSWSPVSGAVSYNVYRGIAAGAEMLLATGVTGTTFTDMGVNNITTYIYVVTAVNGNIAPLPNESDKSNEVSATTGVALAASYSSAPPTDVADGSTMSYPITVTNIGTQTWFAGGTNPFKLGVYFSGNSDAIGDWTSEPVRFSLPNDVAPGASVTINVAMPVPATPGTYVLRQRMVEENVAWFAQVSDTAVLVELTVLNGNDDGPGSLRQAISTADGTPGSTHTIKFALPTGQQTINLLSPLPTATDPLTLSLDATQNVTIVPSAGAVWTDNQSLVISGAGSLSVGSGIEGTGDLTVSQGGSLTASDIIQSALMIGGTAGSPAIVTIAASDSSGNPLSADDAAGTNAARVVNREAQAGTMIYTPSSTASVATVLTLSLSDRAVSRPSHDLAAEPQTVGTSQTPEFGYFWQNDPTSVMLTGSQATIAPPPLTEPPKRFEVARPKVNVGPLDANAVAALLDESNNWLLSAEDELRQQTSDLQDALTPDDVVRMSGGGRWL